jgi:hypothetical protein
VTIAGNPPIIFKGPVIEQTFEYQREELKIVLTALELDVNARANEYLSKQKTSQRDYWAKMTPAQRKAEMKRRKQKHLRKVRARG